MMQTLAVNWSNLGMGLFIVWFLLVCVLLMLAVLVQKPQGGGLAGAFGSGAGSGQTAFGAKTGDALTWITVGMFIIWLATAVGLNLAFRPAEAIDPTLISAPAGTPIDGGEGATTAPGEPASGTPATEGEMPIPLEPMPLPMPPAGETPAPAATPTTPPATPPTTPPATDPATEPAPQTTPPPAAPEPQP